MCSALGCAAGVCTRRARASCGCSCRAGLEYETGRVRITPDEAVADAIATVFSYFDQLQSARQVMLRLLEEDRKLPRKSSADRRVRWVKPTYRAIDDILTSPVFAGAYAYGRKRVERRVADGQEPRAGASRAAGGVACVHRGAATGCVPRATAEPAHRDLSEEGKRRDERDPVAALRTAPGRTARRSRCTGSARRG